MTTAAHAIVNQTATPTPPPMDGEKPAVAETAEVPATKEEALSPKLAIIAN